MIMQKRVLITGASGLVGRALVKALVSRNYQVNALSRSKQHTSSPAVRFFEWDVSTGEIDAACIDGVEAVVHLAGENIAALPWSNNRKQAILESRTQSIAMIYELLKKTKSHTVNTVVSASASGYYNDRGDELMTEDQPPAGDFLGQTCLKWEQAVSKGSELGLRTISLRSGVVLSTEGGAYGKLASMVKKRMAAVPGSGKQWMPWVHIADAVSMYILALEHMGIHGVYNLTTPDQVTFSTFVHKVAVHLGKSIWLPNIPTVLLKAVLGQMSEVFLNSTRMSAEKIINAGFEFQYPELDGALADLSKKEYNG